MTRLNISSAVCAVALVLLSGCSADQSTEAGTPASAAPTSAAGPAPAGGPAASASTAPKGELAALCEQVAAAKTALNDELKRVVSPEGQVSQADGKRVMTDLATKLTALAASGKGEVAEALKGLAAEARKAAGASDPVRAASGGSFEAAGQKADNACTNA